MQNKRNIRIVLLAAGFFALCGCGKAASAELPVSYDGREAGRTARVKNQGDLATCWAFASLLALENSMLPQEELDFSEDHMSHNPDFLLGQAGGGDYTMSMAYLLSWQGPVLEAEDPYGDGISPEELLPVKHVQEIQILPSGETEAIKRAVLEHGGVQSSLYTTLTSADEVSEHYNRDTNAYCYLQDTEPNHDVVIVGWDDAFPKEAFSAEVPGDGAFLCENSWGAQFGEDGFFYVSYYDANLGKVNICYSSVEDVENYDHLYQSDRCGWIGQIGYGAETAWAANGYTANGQERLEAVGFYAIDRNTDYEVYVESEEGGELGNRRLAAAGHLEYAGYYTVLLDRAEELEQGERFRVMVKITTPGAVHPIAIEYDTGDGKCSLNLEDGEGYISADGEVWSRLETEYNCNLCLKAYSSDR